MISTVVGSFPAEKKEPSSFKDKLLNSFGKYDPFKEAIKECVIAQLDAGVDIISDGQVRGDMLSSFTRYIPGMKLEEGNTVIFSKIRKPTKEISINDLKYAKGVMKDYFNGNIPPEKGIKGIITGPSTIVHSSSIESFYKNKEDAIIDLAYSLKEEVMAIDKKVKPKYIQIDEPFLSTGMVDLKIAKKAIDIVGEDLTVPLAMHVCGNLKNVFEQLANFNVDISTSPITVAFSAKKHRSPILGSMPLTVFIRAISLCVCMFLIDYYCLKPFFLFEEPQDTYYAKYHQYYRKQYSVSPLQYRKVGEIHSIDTCYQRRRHKYYRYDGENLYYLVLLYVDKTDDSVLQILEPVERKAGVFEK